MGLSRGTGLSVGSGLYAGAHGLWDGASGLLDGGGSPSVGPNIYNGAALASYFTALAGRNSAPVNIMACPGDSVTEGQSNGNNIGAGNRWCDVLETLLQAKYPTSGVSSRPTTRYRSAYWATPGTGTPYTSLIGTGHDASIPSMGLGARENHLNTNGSGWLYTENCTKFYLDYFTTSATTGTFNISIDGGAPTTFVSGTTVPYTSTTWASPTLSNTSHTIQITQSGSGYITLLGLRFERGDAGKGIRVYEGGHAGYSASNYNTADLFQQFATGLANATMAIVPLGYNELQNGVAPATYKANLINTISYIRANKASLPILLLYYPTPDSAVYTYPWAQYIAKGVEICDADSLVALYDLTQYMPPASIDTTYFDSSRIHFLQAGYTQIATLLSGQI